MFIQRTFQLASRDVSCYGILWGFENMSWIISHHYLIRTEGTKKQEYLA